MIKKLFYIFLVIQSANLFSQIDSGSLMSLPKASSIDLDNILSPKLGSLAYDTDKDRVVEYTSEGWLEIKTTRDVHVGAFIITEPGQKKIDIPFKPYQITFVAHANIDSLDSLDDDNDTGNNDRGIDNSFGTMNGFTRNDNTPPTQQVIYVGGSGNSINDISRYASSSNCIAIRYSDQNGNSLGKITANLHSFNTDGFTINVTYTNGDITVNNGNSLVDVQPEDVLNEKIVVLFTAYK